MKSWWIQVVDNKLISSIDMQNTESCKKRNDMRIQKYDAISDRGHRSIRK